MKRYVPIIRFFLDKLKRDNVGAYAGQATLFIIMSVIPFLLVLTYLMRFTPVTESVVLNAIEKVAPGMVAPYLVSILDEVYNNSGKLLVAAIIIAVYSSAKAVQSLRYGLNIVYDIYETRNWFVLRLRAMLETFTLILIMILLMVMLVFGQRIQDVLVQHAPIVSIVTDWILRLRFVIIFLFLMPQFIRN